MSTSTKTKSAAPPTPKALPDGLRLALEEIGRWREGHTPPTELDHRTFEAKYPVAYCEQLASSTKARGTLKDAREWLRKLHPAPGKKPIGDAGVPSVTLALFIEYTQQLAVAVESMNQGASDAPAVQVEVTRAAANLCYRSTKARVVEAIGQNDTWNRQLAEHLDSDRHSEVDADAARLLRLRDAIRGWLKSKDEVVKHALQIEGVTPETEGACTKAASELEAARAAAAGTKDSGRDPPLVNRIEGCVLVLMQSVYRAVNEAREQKKTTLVLQPGAATRRVITPNARVRKAKVSEGDEAPAAPGAQVVTAAKRPKKRKTR
jgi:hypothetical protein